MVAPPDDPDAIPSERDKLDAPFWSSSLCIGTGSSSESSPAGAGVAKVEQPSKAVADMAADEEIASALEALLERIEARTSGGAGGAGAAHVDLCLCTASALLRHLDVAFRQDRAARKTDAATAGASFSSPISASSPLWTRRASSFHGMLQRTRSKEDNSKALIYDTVLDLDDSSAPPPKSPLQVKRMSFSTCSACGDEATPACLPPPTTSFSFSSEKSEDTSRCYIHPERTFRLGWDATCLLMILMVALLAPMEIAFFFDNDPPLPFPVVSWILDVYFVIDIVLNFFTAYHDGHGVAGSLVTCKKKIAIHYLRGYFTLDILATLPYVTIADLLLGSSSSSGSDAAGAAGILKIFKYAKVARVLKVLRVFKLGGLMLSVEEKLVAKQSMTVAFQLSKMITIMFILSHSAGCVWFAMAYFNGGGDELTWLEVERLVDATTYEQYVASLYFTITTGTTVGYGDISPANTLERLMTSFLLVISVAYIGQFLGRCSQIVGSLRENEQKMGKTKRDALLFMLQRGVPRPLQFKVLRYIEHTYEINSFTAMDAQFFDHLSDSLRSELALEVTGDIYRKFPLFKDASTEFLTSLCAVGSTKRAGIGDVVVAVDQAAHDMFWVVRGEAVVRRNDMIVDLLKQGDWFGELALFFPGAVRSATVRCETNCEFLFLQHDLFWQQVREFPIVKKKMEDVMDQLRQGNPTALQLRCAWCGSKDHTTEDCENKNKFLSSSSKSSNSIGGLERQDSPRSGSSGPRAARSEGSGL